MRIAVISDTHDRVPRALPGRLRGADEIWHLGDVCSPDVLAEFASLGPPLLVVRGNCDEPDAWPLVLTPERGGVKFFLTHIPPSFAEPADGRPSLGQGKDSGLAETWAKVLPGRSDAGSGALAGVTAILHGHTHVARDEMIGGVRWLNPGAITRPRAGAASWAWLTVADGALTSWETMRI